VARVGYVRAAVMCGGTDVWALQHSADVWALQHSAERGKTDSNVIQRFQTISNKFKSVQILTDLNRTFLSLIFLK
jgi:hypothetical protein